MQSKIIQEKNYFSKMKLNTIPCNETNTWRHVHVILAKYYFGIRSLWIEKTTFWPSNSFTKHREVFLLDCFSQTIANVFVERINREYTVLKKKNSYLEKIKHMKIFSSKCSEIYNIVNTIFHLKVPLSELLKVINELVSVEHHRAKKKK